MLYKNVPLIVFYYYSQEGVGSQEDEGGQTETGVGGGGVGEEGGENEYDGQTGEDTDYAILLLYLEAFYLPVQLSQSCQDGFKVDVWKFVVPLISVDLCLGLLYPYRFIHMFSPSMGLPVYLFYTPGRVNNKSVCGKFTCLNYHCQDIGLPPQLSVTPGRVISEIVQRFVNETR